MKALGLATWLTFAIVNLWFLAESIGVGSWGFAALHTGGAICSFLNLRLWVLR